MAYWRTRCPHAGATVKFKDGRRLVGDRTAKSRLEEVRITELQFADDVTVFATTHSALENGTSQFVCTALEWNLTVSVKKTKAMAVCSHLPSADTLPIQLSQGSIDVIQDFNYLSSNITDDGEVKNEVSTRIGRASRAFGCLQSPYSATTVFLTKPKRKVYQATTRQCFCTELRLGPSKHTV